jgi:hypothetical protein
MATLNVNGTIDVDMMDNNTVNHAAQSAPVNSSEYSWTTTSGILIHAFSFADDITFNATSPLGGTVHALQAVNSYVVGGLVGDLLSMTTAFNNENYWRPILSDDSSIFASSFADFHGAGDFVNVAGGETFTGSDDLFEGAEPPAIGATTQDFFGDADTVQNTAFLTGGNDAINMRAEGTISGDARAVFGKLTGGDDTIVIDGSAIFSGATRVSGDAVFVSDLEQPIKPTVIGGRDTIIVKQYAGGAISGDILDASGAALGTTTGGMDLIDASANASTINAFGDVANLGNHTVKGGRDTLIGSATVGSVLSGDAGNMTGGTLFAGADTLIGGENGDFLYGDVVNQTGGTVSINTTSYTGDDTLFGRGGDDQIFGQVGDDRVDGGMGNDILDGGTQTAGVGDIVAFDSVNVAVSADLLLGFAFGQGTDGISNFESLRGSNRSDSLAGDSSDNQIEGLTGNDHIFGRQGNDILMGGNGNDTITGGAGADTLVGDAGSDRFNYDLTSESGIVAASRDVIQSFVQGIGGDLIDVHDIDAKTSVGGNQNFAFIGNAAFGFEGQIRFDVVGSHTILEFNTSGSSGAEMTIDLAGVFTPTAADFIL